PKRWVKFFSKETKTITRALSRTSHGSIGRKDKMAILKESRKRRFAPCQGNCEDIVTKSTSSGIRRKPADLECSFFLYTSPVSACQQNCKRNREIIKSIMSFRSLFRSFGSYASGTRHPELAAARDLSLIAMKLNLAIEHRLGCLAESQ